MIKIVNLVNCLSAIRRLYLLSEDLLAVFEANPEGFCVPSNEGTNRDAREDKHI